MRQRVHRRKRQSHTRKDFRPSLDPGRKSLLLLTPACGDDGTTSASGTGDAGTTTTSSTGGSATAPTAGSAGTGEPTTTAGLSGYLHMFTGTSKTRVFGVGETAGFAAAIVVFDGIGWSTAATPPTAKALFAGWSAATGEIYAVGKSGTILIGK